MPDLLIRASSLGEIMTEPRTKSEGVLSKGAKTYLRGLVRQDILGVEDEVGSKQMEKGIECEPDSIVLLNRVLGLDLSKNTERRTKLGITGECDLFDPAANRGYDVKTSWSTASFPCFVEDAQKPIYEWQARAYMFLWDADEWDIAYCLVDTPERLIGFENMAMHTVSHIPESVRLTLWNIPRDMDKETLIIHRVQAAQEYMEGLYKTFADLHMETT